MRQIGVMTALLMCTAASAAAQTKGKVSVGASVTYAHLTDSAVDSLVGYGPFVRLNPRKGWGVAGGLSWFRADVDNPSGDSGPFGRLRVRPLMGGVAYTVGEQPVLVSFSIVAGPSFNSFDFEDAFLNSIPAGLPQPDIDIKTSFAVRPGVNVTWTVASRVAIVGFAGYSYNRPDIVYRDTSGRELRDVWKADAVLLSIGACYSLF
jgi:Outer membrane protein beta-barrel domain